MEKKKPKETVINSLVKEETVCREDDIRCSRRPENYAENTRHCSALASIKIQIASFLSTR